jgi:citrate lyase subunit beta/citryl-CoA lyase
METRPQGTGTAVRINALDTPYWQEDVKAVVRAEPDIILIPKADGAEYVKQAVAAIEAAESEYKQNPKAEVVALVESSLGVENAFRIARAHERLVGMLLGAEDLTANLGAQRTAGGQEILYARGRMLMACKAADIKAIDSPFPFVADIEGLKKDAAFAAQLGFDGKAVISPHHVHSVNEAFTPTPEQSDWAKRVTDAAKKAETEGKGAISLDGMMIDLPIIKRAERILLMAEAEGRRGDAL